MIRSHRVVESRDLEDGAGANTKVLCFEFPLPPKDTTRPSPLAVLTEYNSLPGLPWFALRVGVTPPPPFSRWL